MLLLIYNTYNTEYAIHPYDDEIHMYMQLERIIDTLYFRIVLALLVVSILWGRKERYSYHSNNIL